MVKDNSLTVRDYIHASAPYIAVIVGMYWLGNAWISLLIYHLQIVIYSLLHGSGERKALLKGINIKVMAGFLLPLVLFGLLLYMLLGQIPGGKQNIGAYLQQYNLTGLWFALFIPYFCIVHPVLEELHWMRFRLSTKYHFIMYILFSGYHALVLYGILGGWLIMLALFVMILVALIWDLLHKKLGGGIVPLASHIGGDIAIIAAVYSCIS